jgi:soluble lytic murein transglycosylase-like protein
VKRAHLVALALGAAVLFWAWPALAGDYVTSWARHWGVPPKLVRGVIRTESRGNPRATAKHAGDVARGGAFGLMQVTLATAREAVAQLAKAGGSVARVLRRWDGTGASLYDPELNVMLGTYLLARNYQHIGAWPGAVLAYNRGVGGARSYIAAGNDPARADYVAKVYA